MGREKEPRQESIVVKLGEPFHVSADLQAIEKEYEGGDRDIAVIPIEVDGIGPGKVTVRCAPEELGDDFFGHLRTPAGPVKVTRIIDNDEARFDYETTPFAIEIEIACKDRKNLKGITASLTYKNARFEEADLYGPEDREEFQTVSIYTYTDSEGVPCTVYFPHDPEVLEEIAITIDKR